MAYREQTIRERAYFIWQHQGCPEGQALNHWLCAERERSVADEYPGLSLDGVAATVAAVEFYQANYDVVVNRAVSARGRKEFLGHEPSVCRFCTKITPEVTFRKEAHAIPELAGNGTLLSYFECDDCNERFSHFEDDLGKLTLLERISGQVLGKKGVPSAKTRQKRSRIDMGEIGFEIRQYEGDPFVEIDYEAQTLTVTVPPQHYRPLGVYKALVKVALTLMDENDLPKVVEAIRWLRAGDLVTDRIDDGTKYTCLRSFTPGPAPFPVTRAVLFRRKRSDVLGPAFVFLLMFGNISFQIFLPAPSEDRHLIGRDIILRAVPVFSFQAKDSVKGPTRFWKAHLSSVSAMEGPKSAVFHFDVATRTRGEP